MPNPVVIFTYPASATYTSSIMVLPFVVTTPTDDVGVTGAIWSSPLSGGICDDVFNEDTGLYDYYIYNVALTYGANPIVVTAFDSGGLSGSGTLTIYYTGAEPPTLVANPYIINAEPNHAELDPSTVLLANLYVSASSTVDNLELVDTRRRGGGLDPRRDVRTASLLHVQQEESKKLWDIDTWDGPPTMTNGTITIKIPSESLIENGGTFSHSQIEELVAKNIPVGILPIIEYT